MLRSLRGFFGRQLRARTGYAELKSELAALRATTADARIAATTAQWNEILTHSAWSAHAPLRDTPLISVVLATRNRADRVAWAVDSVRSQSYPHFELIAVLDGCTDHTAAYFDGLADDRVRVLTTAGIGAAGARNAALAAARGSIVTFIDDDNVMAQGCLRAVAEFFARRQAVVAAYGAQIRQHNDPDEPSVALLFRSFDRDHLERQNYIDLGAVAIRRTARELHFDVRLRGVVDWDMLLRVSEHTDLVPLPALASVYLTDAPDRISDRADIHDIADAVRRARTRS